MMTIRGMLLQTVSLLALLFAPSAPAVAYEPPQPVEKTYFVFHSDNPSYITPSDSALTAARSRLIGLLRDSLYYKPDIYIVGDQDYFQQLIGGSFPDWGAAAALPSLKRIVIKSPDRFNLGRPLPELLSHEYAHLAVAGRVGLSSAPRWFDEGMAMMVSMEWNWSDNLAMSNAAVFGHFIPLREIDLVNRFPEGKAHLAYAESYLALTYLVKQYGVISLNLFLDEIAKGHSVDSALMAATGSDRNGFEQEFRTYLDSRFNFTSLLMDTIYFWMALALVLVVGTVIRYRKRRKYYREWQEDQKFQSTDFDYGDPRHPEKTDDDDDEPWRS
jgi:hypothetical protein